MTRDDSLRLSRIGMALLEKLPPRHHGHVVVVTSALAGEGKSFVSAQLSTRLARVLHAPVAQIDATDGHDVNAVPGGGFAGLVRRGRLALETVSSPSEPQSFPSDGGPTTLGGFDTTDQVVRLAAGTRVQPALFQIDGVGRALAQLQRRFRVSVVDAPVLTDCGALLWHADAVVLVVDSLRTDPATVRRSMAEASLDPARVAGVVLNRARRDRHMWSRRR